MEFHRTDFQVLRINRWSKRIDVQKSHKLYLSSNLKSVESKICTISYQEFLTVASRDLKLKKI